ncbi:tail fiber protein [Flavobacterium sp. F-65]|uniref:Tail fiber protein n=1 Tax=Flavobacterium pisciphilum TaxID=2893755 RepID=A0ABS8N0H8_9FLAO|nr:tail fiber protein [Flavobacterium sp. F-65]MCC9073590.1 tail fiber protein [Flavobacterium sp. F-65]
MKKILLLIIVNYITTTYCQSFDGNLDSKSLFWAMEQKNFESLPRVGIPPMSIKLWDNYNSTVAPSQYGSLLEINGRVGHLVSQLYFSGNWDNGRVQYRSSFYGQPNWQDWRYLLDSKNDIETSGNLKINGNGNSYILNGNLGIGIPNPVSKLTLLGSLTINSGLTNASTRPIISSGTLSNGEIRGYNAANPLADDGFLRLSAGGGTNNVKSYIDLSGYSTQSDMYANIVMGTGGRERMRIDSNGNVGIGTTNPDEKLTVNGKIHAQEVRIDLQSPMTVPDYVFANDYKLKSLQEVEEFIKENSHLPEIPSAKEIEKNGFMLAEMNMSLLKKIEELTLYSIEQSKKILIIEKQNERLEIENQAFKSLSERLSKLENQLE